MTEAAIRPLTPQTPPFPADRTCPYHPPVDYEPLKNAGTMHRATLYDGREVWMVTGHAEARALLTDKRLSTDRRSPGFPVIAPRAENQAEVVIPLLGVDDPLHAAQRRMLIPSFTLKRVAAMRPQIQRIVDGLLDTMAEQGGPTDLVASFALPVPSMVICSLLGVPYDDHEFFEQCSRKLLTAETAGESKAARLDLEDYLLDLVVKKEAEPGEGLLDELIADRLAAGELDRHELVLMALLLLVAGHETTSNMIALGMYTLLEHPEELEALRADPSLIPGAVEELLRFLSIADGMVRVALEDIELDGGGVIKTGEGVILSTSMINRDAGTYEDPDGLDVRRSARHHVAFGFGVHQCLGQNLARAELEIALTALLTRFPTLRLAVPADQVPLKPGDTLQGLFAMPVTW
ncbi:cytochrome P450 [Streptomyces varsoviensis]|uniref:cytochrome P450 n=1 Tax=Streptomyces varsoviensis TaxID=67373 RepID=UPI0004CB0282|nr:cytochrome P450 [Streptomyces varsoviensis]